MLIPLATAALGTTDADTTAPISEDIAYANDKISTNITERDSLPVNIYWATYDTGSVPTLNTEVQAGTGAYESGSYLNQNVGKTIQTNILTSSTPNGSRALAWVIEDSANPDNLSIVYSRTFTQVDPYTENLVDLSGITWDLNSKVADTTSWLYFFSGTPNVSQQHTLWSWQSTQGRFDISSGGAVRLWVPNQSNTRIEATSGAITSTTARTHILGRGFEDSGTLTIEGIWWQTNWSSVFSGSAAGETFSFSTFSATPQRWYGRTGDLPALNIADMDVARHAFWTGVSPDISLTSVQENFVNGGSLRLPSVARTAYGTPQFDHYGDEDDFNSGASNGLLGNATVNDGPAVNA